MVDPGTARVTAHDPDQPPTAGEQEGESEATSETPAGAIRPCFAQGPERDDVKAEPGRPSPATCRLYFAGHKVHHIHVRQSWKHGLGLPVAIQRIDPDGYLTLTDGTNTWRYWNHDPDAVRRARDGGGQALLCDLHLLCVRDPSTSASYSTFNLAPTRDECTPPRLPATP